MKTAISAPGVARTLALLASFLPSIAIAAWMSVAPMPTGVADPQYTSVGGIFFAAGGYSTGGAVPALQIYDQATNSWYTQRADMPGTRYQGTMQAIGTRLYLVGGWNGPLPTSSLMIYDYPGNTWSAGADFPSLSGCGQSGALSGQMYVLNACNGYSGYVHDFYSYNPGTNTWTARASPSYDHAYGAAGVIGGKLYVAGGFDDGLQTHTRLEIYDPVTDTWSAGPAMPGQRANAGSAVLNEVLYVIGGQDGSARLTSTVAYDPASGSWTTLPDLLPGGLQQLGAMGYGNQLYAFGGYTTSQVGQGYSLAITGPGNSAVQASATISTNQASFTENSNEVLALSGAILSGSSAGTAADIYIQANVAGFGVFYLGPPPAWIWSTAAVPVATVASLADIDAPNFYVMPIIGLPATTYNIRILVLRSGGNPGSPTDVLATATSAITITPQTQPPPPPAPSPCTYSLFPDNQTFDALGGSGWMTVEQRESTCLVVEWIPSSNADWITGVYAYGMSNGNGNVAYTVLPNTTPAQRQETISVAGQIFTVTQSGANPFQGRIVGSWGGTCDFPFGPVSASGNFSMNIDAAGGVSGTYSGTESGMISGGVGAGGNFSAAGAASGGVSWQGQFSLVGGILQGNGTWSDSGFCSGSWASSP